MKTLHSYARFSTIGQDEKHGGDSERRQIEDAKSFAKRHGFTLSNLTLIDRGRGAFKGNKQAALAEFLKAIKDGMVKSGDTLLVENIDRLSRKGVRETQTLVNQIFAGGVDIAILFPTEKIYRAKDVNDIGGAIELAAFAYTAHTYSANLSYRIKSKHAEQRKAAIETGKAKSMSMPPQWLAKDNGIFKPIPAAVKAIEYIFARTIEGAGCTVLCKELNRKFKPLGRSKKWTLSYVRRLLTDRRVLGEWQPVEIDEQGRKHPIGEPQRHYLQIIDLETFERANYAGAHRRFERGPSGDWINLFGGLVYHGLDDCTCQIHSNRQKLVDDRKIIHRRLISANAVDGVKGASPEGLHIKVFEEAVLQHLRELDYSLLSEDKSKRIAIDSLLLELARKEKRLAEVQKEMEKDDQPIKVLAATARTLEKDIKALKTKIAESKASKGGLDVIKQATDAQDPEVRERLREAIKRVVRRIVLFPYKLGEIRSSPIAAAAVIELVSGNVRIIHCGKGYAFTTLFDESRKVLGRKWDKERDGMAELCRHLKLFYQTRKELSPEARADL